ncbi:MAG: hypothetical protein ACE5Q6_05360 [Dehalococcoidia bacterium]
MEFDQDSKLFYSSRHLRRLNGQENQFDPRTSYFASDRLHTYCPRHELTNMGCFWIPWFRLCWANQDKIVVTPPLLFGRGYVFDQRCEIVLICRRLLGFPLSNMEIPFSSVRDVSLRERDVEEVSVAGGAGTYGGTSGGYTKFLITMTAAPPAKSFCDFLIAEVSGSLAGSPLLGEQWSLRRANTLREPIRELLFGTLIEDIKRSILLSVSKTPGISHTQLVQSLDGDRNWKDLVIGQLVGEGWLKLERKGKVRRYFPNKPPSVLTT